MSDEEAMLEYETPYACHKPGMLYLCQYDYGTQATAVAAFALLVPALLFSYFTWVSEGRARVFCGVLAAAFWFIVSAPLWARFKRKLDLSSINEKGIQRNTNFYPWTLVRRVGGEKFNGGIAVTITMRKGGYTGMLPTDQPLDEATFQHQLGKLKSLGCVVDHVWFDSKVVDPWSRSDVNRLRAALRRKAEVGK